MNGRSVLSSLLAAILFLLFGGVPAYADGSLVKATVRDLNGRGVAGAKLFVYDSANTRRAADFISVKSGADGSVAIGVPPGKYWVVAREKKDGTYGPLAPGDRHSGEPVELELIQGKETEAEFVVADIQEVGERKRLNTAEFVRVTGRILDPRGAPVANAYVYARQRKGEDAIPEFVSAWTGADGGYQLHLPVGVPFSLAAGQTFPPAAAPALYRELLPQAGKLPIALDLTLPVE